METNPVVQAVAPTVAQAVKQAGLVAANADLHDCPQPQIDIDTDGDGVKDGSVFFLYQAEERGGVFNHQRFFRPLVAYLPFQNKGQKASIKGLDNQSLAETPLLGLYVEHCGEYDTCEGGYSERRPASCQELPFNTPSIGNYDGDSGEDVRIVLSARKYLDETGNTIETPQRDLLLSIKGGELFVRPLLFMSKQASNLNEGVANR